MDTVFCVKTKTGGIEMELVLITVTVVVVARILYFYVIEKRRWKKYNIKMNQKITEMNKKKEERMREECLELKSKLKPGESLIGCDEFMKEG